MFNNICSFIVLSNISNIIWISGNDDVIENGGMLCSGYGIGDKRFIYKFMYIFVFNVFIVVLSGNNGNNYSNIFFNWDIMIFCFFCVRLG